jgi:hypothetical protein
MMIRGMNRGSDHVKYDILEEEPLREKERIART